MASRPPAIQSPTKPEAIRILVVDDNPAALYATSRILRAAGYEVIEARTGAAALESAPRSDLVVLDINLPDIDGFEVCRRLRQRPETAQLPVLHLSATFTQSADFDVGLQAGADSYLTRPCEPPVLIATVRTLIFARHADLIRRGLDAKLRTMFNLAPVAIAILDPEFHYESVNPAYCTLTGYTAEEMIGLSGTRFLTAESADSISTVIEQVETRGLWKGQVSLRRKNGELAKVEWQVAKEGISGVRILTATDVTNALRAEQAREELLHSERMARAEAERSNRAKEEFLATLSHELRNPLNAILGWSILLGRTPDLPPAATKGVQAIERNSKLQAQMIADLLDYAGISFGKMRLVRNTIDPYPVVRAALEVARISAQAEGIEIHETFADEDLLVEADPARLQQIILNLLSNAVKFSNRGGRVELNAQRRGDSFRLSVTDHGKGIDPEFLPRIFERFSQQDATSTRSHGGLGLGLAIVKQLTDLHMGSVEALSEGPGRGASFVVTIPLSSNAPSDKSATDDSAHSSDLTGVVALIVEDDTDARELTMRILTDAGAKVIEAANADSALQQIVGSNANLLISDIGMAEQDGYQLIRKIRSLGYDANRLPAIALTAFARAQDRTDAFAAGFQDHLLKPLDPHTLIYRVAALRRLQFPAPIHSDVR